MPAPGWAPSYCQRAAPGHQGAVGCQLLTVRGKMGLAPSDALGAPDSAVLDPGADMAQKGLGHPTRGAQAGGLPWTEGLCPSHPLPDSHVASLTPGWWCGM